MSNSPFFKVQSLALCLPLTLLLACGQNDSKKKDDAPAVQKEAPAEPAPAPLEPTAGEPVPVVPGPLPAPLEPSVTPAPVEPTPAEPAPVEPAPAKPAPVEPAPVKPAPVEPAPVKPAPVEPAPAKPAPVEPAPVKPAPVEPAPSKPAPSKPAQQAEIVGTWAGCEVYEFTSSNYKASGSAYFVATFGADGTYKAQQAFFTDAECKVPFTQDAADRMKADGAQFEEQELQDYLKPSARMVWVL